MFDFFLLLDVKKAIAYEWEEIDVEFNNTLKMVEKLKFYYLLEHIIVLHL